jgi:thiol-disulfide isomerase/thioredoxin
MSAKLCFFYMNGCGWCDRFMPTLNKLKENKICEIYECESSKQQKSDEAKQIQKQLNTEISSYPSIFLEVNGKYKEYQGDRSYENVVDFIKENSQKSESRSKSETINLTGSVELFLFHMNGCHWCVEFMPIWKELQKEKTDYKYYSCERAELDNSKEAQIIQEKLGYITSFPSIFIKVGDEYFKYNGKRLVDNIVKFINEIIKKEQFIQNGGVIDYRLKYKKYKEMYSEILTKYNELKNKS